MINKPKRKKREAIIFLINAKDKMKLLRHCRKQDVGGQRDRMVEEAGRVHVPE